MIKFVRSWYAAIWTDPILRQRVAGEYAALASSRHLLADIAIRGGLYAPGPDVTDLFQAGMVEGRRRFALETLALVRVDPAELADVTVKTGETSDAAKNWISRAPS